MSQNKCTNCGALMGCSCQRRTASNGHSCCSACVGSYENTLRKPGSGNNNHANSNPGAPIQTGSLYPRGNPGQ